MRTNVVAEASARSKFLNGSFKAETVDQAVVIVKQRGNWRLNFHRFKYYVVTTRIAQSDEVLVRHWDFCWSCCRLPIATSVFWRFLPYRIQHRGPTCVRRDPCGLAQLLMSLADRCQKLFLFSFIKVVLGRRAQGPGFELLGAAHLTWLVEVHGLVSFASSLPDLLEFRTSTFGLFLRLIAGRGQ